jgi:uncharacterized protein (DUF427 family)
MKAIWNGEIIAESNKTIEIESNHYFPPTSVKKEFLIKTDLHSTCPWKGEASYYSLSVNGKVNINAAWYYANPKEAAAEIKDYIAFWKGVEIVG